MLNDDVGETEEISEDAERESERRLALELSNEAAGLLISNVTMDVVYREPK